MKEKVYFIQTADNESDAIVCGRLEAFLKSQDLLGIIADRVGLQGALQGIIILPALAFIGGLFLPGKNTTRL